MSSDAKSILGTIQISPKQVHFILKLKTIYRHTCARTPRMHTHTHAVTDLLQESLRENKCPEVRFEGVQRGFRSERKLYVLRLDLNESMEGFCREERGRSFHVQGPKTEKAEEPTKNCP